MSVNWDDFTPEAAEVKWDDFTPETPETPEQYRNESRPDYVPPIDREKEPDAYKKLGFKADALDPKDIRASKDYQNTLTTAEQNELGQRRMTTARRGATVSTLRKLDKAAMGDNSARFGQTEGMDPRDLRAERESLVRPTSTTHEPIYDYKGEIVGGVDVDRVGAPLIQTNEADRPEMSVASVATDLTRMMLNMPADVRDTALALYGDLAGDEQLTKRAVGRSAERRAIEQRDMPWAGGGLGEDVYSGVRSTVQQAPGLAASILTMNPAIGLAYAALAQGVPTYTESREQGMRGTDAFANATIQGGLEALMELPGMKFLVKRFGTKPVMEFIGGLAAREVPLEMMTTITQNLTGVMTKHSLGSDPAGMQRDLAHYLESLPGDLKQTAISTITQTLLMGGASAAASRLPRQREPIPAAEDMVRGAGFTAEPDQAGTRQGGYLKTPGMIERHLRLKALQDAQRQADDAAVLGAQTVDEAIEAFTQAANRPSPLVDGLGEAMQQTSDEALLARLQEQQAAEQPQGIVGQAISFDQSGEVRPMQQQVAGPSQIDAAASEAATSPSNDRAQPTDGQKEAGNYKKGHTTVGPRGASLGVSIENEAGSSRRPEWPPLQDHYGYFKRTDAADSEPGKKQGIDAFFVPGTPHDYSGPVYVVDQIDPKTGGFDEHKVVVGASSRERAEQVYRRNYEKDWNGLGAITEMPWQDFHAWATRGNTKQALAYREGQQQAAPTAQPAGEQLTADEVVRRMMLPPAEKQPLPMDQVRKAAESLTMQQLSDVGEQLRVKLNGAPQGKEGKDERAYWNRRLAAVRDLQKIRGDLDRGGLTPSQESAKINAERDAARTDEDRDLIRQLKEVAESYFRDVGEGAPFAKGIRYNYEHDWTGHTTKRLQDALEFYRQRYAEDSAPKRGEAAPAKDTASLAGFYFDKPDQLKVLDAVKKGRGTKLKASVIEADRVLQAIADRINAAGWSIERVQRAGSFQEIPKEIRDLAEKLPHIGGSGWRAIKQQHSVDKGYKRGDKEKAAAALFDLNQAIDEARELLGEGEWVKAPTPRKKVERTLPADATADEVGEFRRLELIQKLKDSGGISLAERSEITGEHAQRGNRIMPGLFVHGGMGIDMVASWMQERGYLPWDMDGHAAATKAQEIIRDALDKRGVFTIADLDDIAEREYAERLAGPEPDEELAPSDAQITPAEAEELLGYLPDDTTLEEVEAIFDADRVLNELGITPDDPRRDEIKEEAYYASNDEGITYEDALRAAARKAGAGEARAGSARQDQGEEEDGPAAEAAPDDEIEDEADGAIDGADPDTYPFSRMEVVFPPDTKTVQASKLASGETLTPKQAKERLAQWKAEAERIGLEEDHSNEVVFSLFDHSGQWSKPFKDAGYDVRRYDIKNGDDLQEFFPIADIMEAREQGKRIVGVLAAPPCTSFAVSGARWWKDQHDKANQEMVEKKYGWRASRYFDTPLDYANTLVRLTEAFIEFANPELFHAVENPVGRIAEQNQLPKPLLSFDPSNFGDPYTKKTFLWGKFNAQLPTANVEATMGSFMHTLRGDKPEEKALRSLTPEGFAYAFFMANHDQAAARTEPRKPKESAVKLVDSGWDFENAFPRPQFDTLNEAGRDSMFEGVEENDLPDAVAGVTDEALIGISDELSDADTLIDASERGVKANTREIDLTKPEKKATPEQLEAQRKEARKLLDNIRATIEEYGNEFGDEAGQAFGKYAAPELDQLQARLDRKPAKTENDRIESQRDAGHQKRLDDAKSALHNLKHDARQAAMERIKADRPDLDHGRTKLYGTGATKEGKALVEKYAQQELDKRKGQIAKLERTIADAERALGIGQSVLENPTPESLAQRENAQIESERNAKKERAAAENAALEAQRAKESKQQADKTVDDFQLGQTADEQLGGKDLFADTGETPSGAPRGLDSYISAEEYEKSLRDTYFSGGKAISSRTEPQTAAIPPVGTWRIDERAGPDGREIQQLVELDVDNLEISEDTGPEKWGDVQRFAEWWRDGREPPPINVIQHESGSLKAQDHRRLLAAKALGKKTIKAWVNWTVPAQRDGYNGPTGLTYELALAGAKLTPVKPAREDFRIFKDDARALERIKDALKPSPASEVARVLRDAAAKIEKALAPQQQSLVSEEKPIADVGENLQANRRNFTGKALSWSDVKDLAASLKVKEVVKSKVWPKPDYAKLVDDGMPVLVARAIKHVYDSISTTPNKVDDAGLQAYIDAVTRVRNKLDVWANDKAALKSWADAALEVATKAKGGSYWASMGDQNYAILKAIWPDPAGRNGVQSFQGNTEAANDIRALGGRKPQSAMQIGLPELKKFTSDISEKGWPGSQEAWQKQGYQIIPSADAVIIEGYRFEGDPANGKQTTLYRVKFGNKLGSPEFGQYSKSREDAEKSLATAQATPYWVFDKRGRLVGNANTIEAAQDVARNVSKKEPKGGRDLRGMNIAESERKGPEHRSADENISADRLKETFGFRGVNFGREGWINQAERQEYLNQAYDGLMDLAEIMGVPPLALSLNGELGIAFGAQGKGGAHAAHFVPGYNEINLTKTMGAGTLAHEFGHALDHHFAKQAGVDRSTEPFLSEHLKNASTLRPEILAAFKAISGAMNRRPMTPEETALRQKETDAYSLKKLDDWIAHMRKAVEKKPEAAAAYDKLAEKLRKGEAGEYVNHRRLPMHETTAAMRTLIESDGDKASGVMLADNWKGLEANAAHWAWRLSKKGADKAHIPQDRATDYANASAAKDKDKGGKRYWSTQLEMFARSFETWVSSRLAEVAQVNTFLSDADIRAKATDRSGGFAAPYPRGAEAGTINAAFTTLVESLKARETDRGVTLEDRTPSAKRTWYSELLVGVEGINAKAMTAGDWLVRIKSLKGVKADEIAWSGIEEWLKTQEQLGGKSALSDLVDGEYTLSPAEKKRIAANPGLVSKKITKEQVLEYLRNNGVQVEEVMMAEGEEDDDPFVNLPTSVVLDERTLPDIDEDGNAVDADPETAETEYTVEIEQDAIYTITGSDFAGSWFVVDPDGAGVGEPHRNFYDARRAAEEHYKEKFDAERKDRGIDGPTQFAAYQIPGGENYTEILLTLPESRASSNFDRSHWGVPNVLAHVRFNERTDADGKRVLFIEEIQSDWAQKGRKSGFKTLDRLIDGHDYDWWSREADRMMSATPFDRAAAMQAAENRNALAGKPDEVPAAPFVGKTDAWTALAMKRITKYAVDNGFDRIAWTTGEQQADRYSLSRQVERIGWGPLVGEKVGQRVLVTLSENKGTFAMETGADNVVVKAEGIVPVNHSTLLGHPLDDILGKEVAKKITSQHVGTIDGEGLKIGGEGMIGFYDKIVPKVANDILKKLDGGKVGTVDIANETDRRVGQRWPQPGFDITPAMREKAAGGMPLFDRTAAAATTEKLTAFSPYGNTRIDTMLRRYDSGKWTAERVMNELEALLARRAAARAETADRDRVRGYEWVHQKLWDARRTGALTKEEVDLALWMLERSPQLATNLGISVVTGTREDPNGTYNVLARIVKIFALNSNENTATHEILHHTERMMPQEVQDGIRKEWLARLQAASENSKTVKMDAGHRVLLDMMLEAAKAGDDRLALTIWKGVGSGKNLQNVIPYQLAAASEYWAVNAARLMRQRYDAANGGWIAKAKQWLREFIEKVKALFGLRSDAPIIRGLRAVLAGDGSFVSEGMISDLSTINEEDERAGREATDIASRTEDQQRDINRRIDGGSVLEDRTRGLPTGIKQISSFRNTQALKAHPSYVAAKGGDVDAAVRLVTELVKPQDLERARIEFGNAIYVAPTAEEASGRNAIPDTLAEYYAVSAGGRSPAEPIVQTNRAHHTGAGAMERLLARAIFNGPVEKGGRYVLVDDVSTMGGTLAELANHIQQGGGKVVGTVLLTDASRTSTMIPSRAQLREIERRFGDALRQDFHIDPASLTAAEAGYVLGFRDADSLRNRRATAVLERDARLRARGIRPTGEEEVTLEDRTRAGIQLPEETRTQAFVRYVSDNLNRLQTVQEAVRAAGGRAEAFGPRDVYRAAERFPGIVTDRIDRFTREEVEPLMKAMDRAGITPDELALYAYAKHAPSRNAYVASINPAFGEDDLAGERPGSGMSDADAAAVIEAAGDRAEIFDQLHAQLMAITNKTRDLLRDEGLITAAEAEAWSTMWENYVPLKGFEDEIDEKGRQRVGTGAGFSMRGKETLHAMGRRSRAGQIVENLLLDRERAIIRSEKNRVGKALLDLASANPDPTLWEIDAVERKPRIVRKQDTDEFGEAVGDPYREVIYETRPEAGEHVFSTKVGGKEFRISLRDPLLASAMKNLTDAQVGPVLSFMRDFNGMLSRLYTGLNPTFVVLNGFRDMVTGLIQAQQYDPRLSGKILKHYPGALAAGMRFEYSHVSHENRARPGEWDHWFDEYSQNGGRTGFMALKSLEDKVSEVRSLFHRFDPNAGIGTKSWAHIKQVVEAIEGVNQAVENATRAAAYRGARELGMSPAEAVTVAKNITVNFNRRGELTRWIAPFLLFYNASVQGTAATVKAMKSPRVLAAVGALTAGAVAIALMNVGVGGDDDDEIAYWDKIPDHIKERNLIIMLPPGDYELNSERVGSKGRYIKIPLPYGFNPFAVLGYSIVDGLRHMKDPSTGRSPMKAAGNVTLATLNSYNPAGGTQPLTSVMPVLQPAFQAFFNVNRFGEQLYPTPQFGRQEARAEQYFSNQKGSVFQQTADLMNRATGGNSVRDGVLSIQPAVLENTFRYFTGGLGQTALDATKPLLELQRVGQIDHTSLPFVRQLYGEVTARESRRMYVELRKEAARTLQEFKTLAERDEPMDVDQQAEVMLQLGTADAAFSDALGSLRKQELLVHDDKEISKEERRKALNEIEIQRRDLYLTYLSLWKQGMKPEKK